MRFYHIKGEPKTHLASRDIKLLPHLFSLSQESVEQHVRVACWWPELHSNVSSHTLSPSAHGPQSSIGTRCEQASPPPEHNKDWCQPLTSGRAEEGMWLHSIYLIFFLKWMNIKKEHYPFLIMITPWRNHLMAKRLLYKKVWYLGKKRLRWAPD